MRIERKIEIASTAAEVWKVIGDDFLTVDEWMAGVGNSKELTEGQQVQNAPTIGRMAEIALNPGTFMEEKITAYNPEDMSLTMNTILVNVESPLTVYDTEIKVQPLENNKSEVIWTSWAANEPLKQLGEELSTAVEKGLSDGYYRGLEELKHFVETGKPHERKLAAPHCG